MRNRIAIGADHRGFRSKVLLGKMLEAAGHDIDDFGCTSTEASDYPDTAYAVARAVASAEADLGLLICGSGLGMCMAANKVHHVRAASVLDPHQAEMSRRHNNANVLCLSADMLSETEMISIVDAWLHAQFEGGRHQRRLDRLSQIEKDEALRMLDATARAG